MIKNLWEKFLCLIGDHDWTSKAGQGIKPTDDEMRAGVAGFKTYSRMYCARCGQFSKFTL